MSHSMLISLYRNHYLIMKKINYEHKFSLSTFNIFNAETKELGRILDKTSDFWYDD